METNPYPPSRRLGRRSLLSTWTLPVILALAAFAVPAHSRAQSLAFSDPLTGPNSPNLSIPSDYSYTTQGLQRTGNSVYRSLVKTVSGAHLTAAKFTAEVAVNVAPGDIAFVGLGQGVSNPSYGPNEPTNSFVFRIHNLGGYQSIDTAVAAGFSGNQFLQVGSIGNYAAGSTTVFRITRDGDNVTLSVPSQNISRTYSLAQYQAQMGLTDSNTHFFFGGGGNNNTSITGTRFANAAVTLPVPVVFASGISPVTTWDPIFPATAFPNASALSTPTQTVGPLPDDPNWTNPHPAFVFPKGSHVWEDDPPMNFDANWINSWNDISSRGPAGQNWTKYSTTVTGEGDFVLQFLADNVSWIYLDGALVGYQDWNWASVGTGRYTIRLTGSQPHELVFIIWDGGGAAGGKFRLETTQSFIDNGGGELPPPPPPTDTTPPVISAPSPVTKEAVSASGAIVTFTATANDDVSGTVPVTATPASGSQFPLGISSVSLSATDAAGNTANAQILVHVQDTTPPALTVPASSTAEATSASGAPVSYPAATATDAVTTSPTITYSAASGSTFPLGSTSVTVTAKDAAKNASTGSFVVTVQDTTAPTLTVPGNQVLEATSAAGAVATFSASATDAVTANPTITYGAPSDSTFPIGTTTVSVTATDGANNVSSGSFTITVRDTTAPVIASVTPSSATLWPPNHQMVPITVAVVASDNTGYTAKIMSVSSNEPDNGLGDGDTVGDIQITGNLTVNLRAERGGKGAGRVYTITVEARDGYGNASTRTCTVSVPKSQRGK